MQSSSILAQPLIIGKLTANGRVFKTATSETRATEDGFVSDELLGFYKPIAQAGTPLIITGNLYVTEEGKSTYRMCGADHVDKIEGLSQWAELVHSQGGLLFGQINHCGRQVMAKAMGLDSAVSASGVGEKVMGVKPRPLTRQEIKQAVEAYVHSAEICEQAGFDGVQIHAGHGYLINQFLTPYTNRRDDQYGGSFVKRMRLLLEIYWGIRERTNLTVIMKINGADYLPGRQGLSTAQLTEVARILQDEGLDAVEVTVGHYESGFPMIRGNFGPFFKGLMEEGIGDQLPWLRRFGVTWLHHPLAFIFDRIWPAQEGFNLHYAREFKKKLRIPVICVGGFLTREHMEQAIDGGACDAVSVGRAMIADPYLFRNVLNGGSGPKCSFCNACIARAGRLPVDCYDAEVNPAMQPR